MVIIVQLNDEGKVIKRACIPEDHAIWDGYVLDEGQPIASQPVPKAITRLQRNLWLGKARYAALTTWANSLPEEEKYEASIYLRDAETTERDHPITLAMAQVLGMSSEDIDQAFREASLL